MINYCGVLLFVVFFLSAHGTKIIGKRERGRVDGSPT